MLLALLVRTTTSGYGLPGHIGPRHLCIGTGFAGRLRFPVLVEPHASGVALHARRKGQRAVQFGSSGFEPSPSGTHRLSFRTCQYPVMHISGNTSRSTPLEAADSEKPPIFRRLICLSPGLCWNCTAAARILFIGIFSSICYYTRNIVI